jgi:hypothetical protein
MDPQCERGSSLKEEVPRQSGRNLTPDHAGTEARPKSYPPSPSKNFFTPSTQELACGLW